MAEGALIDIYTNSVKIGGINTTQPPPDNMQSLPSFNAPKNATPQQLQEYQNLVGQAPQNISLVQSQISDARKNFAKNKSIFTEGLVGFVGVSQSGESKCTFSNGWLFILNK